MKRKIIRVLAAALAVSALALGGAAYADAPAGPPQADTSWT